MIFGSLSSIPREQPVRDNLEAIAHSSRDRARLKQIVDNLRPEVQLRPRSVFTTQMIQADRQRILDLYARRGRFAVVVVVVVDEASSSSPPCSRVMTFWLRSQAR